MSNLIIGPGAYRLAGRQAIVWSPASHVGTSREHVLRVPLQDVTPVMDPGVVGAHTSFDGTAREVFTVGSGVHMAEATIRFDHAPESLIQMLAAGARGETLTYYPDVHNAAGKYEIEQVEPTQQQVARLSQVRGIFQEFDVTFRFRKADGSAFGPELFSGLLFSYTPGWDLSRATFSRASDATYDDISATLQTASSGVARDAHYVTDEDGNLVRAIKLEASRTNELHNSDSPATQTRSLGAGDYVLWMEGSGSVDASGATDGSYGTATESNVVENDLTFTVSATQDVTFTVNGSVDRFQCEAGDFRSSFITTAGSSVTRSADSLSFDISGTPLATPQEMTVYCKPVERGTSRITGINTTFWHIGTDGSSTGPHLSLFAGSSEEYRILHDNGTNSVQVAVGPEDFGSVVELRAVLNADGSVLLEKSTDGGAGVGAGPSSAAALGGGWDSDTLILNDGLLNPGFADFIALKFAPGVKTMDEMRALAGEG